MKRYKIFIPFEDTSYSGGPKTFMINLKGYLDRNSFEYLTSYENSKAIFFPIMFNKNVLTNIKRMDGRIIQRLDGVYYPQKHKNRYEIFNKELKEIYLDYSDFVIFQSEYSKWQCFKMLGEKGQTNYEVIVNGVDKNIFFPPVKQKNTNIEKEKIKLVTTGVFRNIDMIQPIVEALDAIKGKYDIELKIVGPILNQDIEKYLKRDFVKLIGFKALEEVAGILRDSHIFVYSYLNPPCPNSVIEAISCAVPVVGFDSGAMSELCYFSRDLLAYVSDDIFQEYKDFNYLRLAEKIMNAIENYGVYEKRALEYSHLYSFDECGGKYVENFKKQLDKIDEVPRIMRLFIRFVNRITKKEMNKKKIENIKNKLLSLSQQQLSEICYTLLEQKCNSISSFDSLRFLFEIENRLYQLLGRESIRYGNGIHTKHKHIRYHNFFLENIPAGSRVLDIGCGNGALTYDIANKVQDVYVYGIDIVPENIEAAISTFSRENIKYSCGNALSDLPDGNYDIIVLSNVLEHIEYRIEFLRKLKEKYSPSKYLLRVPIYERDWRVPLQDELGIDYRLDSTHFIEYKQGEFFNELKEAGLNIKHYQLGWGEIWAEAF